MRQSDCSFRVYAVSRASLPEYRDIYLKESTLRADHMVLAL